VGTYSAVGFLAAAGYEELVETRQQARMVMAVVSNAASRLGIDDTIVKQLLAEAGLPEQATLLLLLPAVRLWLLQETREARNPAKDRVDVDDGLDGQI
jgi:hypothetical protein